MQFRLPLGVAFLLCLLASALSGHAAVFTVDSTNDATDATPGDGLCADSAGACTLRAAVMEANALGGADHVALPAGTYTISIPAFGSPDSDAVGDLDVFDSLEIAGVGAREDVIIEGIWASPHFDRQFELWGSLSIGLTLRSLTLRNGAGDSSGYGGAVSNQAGDLFVTDVAFVANRANLGAAISSTGGRLTVERCEFDRNRTSGENGGAIFVSGGELSVSDSVFTSNAADDGGAISADSFSIVRSQFIGNGGENGGAIFGGAGTIADSLFEANSAWNTASAVRCGPCSIVRTEFRSNTGQAVVAANGDVRSSAFTGNLITYDQPGSVLAISGTLSNSTVSGNTFAYEDSFPAVRAGRVEFSTIVGNQAAVVGSTAIDAHVFGSIVAGNTAAGVPADCDAGFLSVGRNVVGTVNGCIPLPSDLMGTAGDPIDPLLGPIADNGGPTGTHALLDGSPALNSIPINECVFDDDGDPITPPIALPSDQRGALRPQENACDAGSYEAGPACSDGIDNDADGTADYEASGGGDPGCASPAQAFENPQCQDGFDNDLAPGIDFDGGASVNGGIPLDVPDPDCFSPSLDLEAADGDGDGAPDISDNCPYFPNPNQSDIGGVGASAGPDGIGDACQCGDVSGDGRVTTADATLVTRSLLVPPTASLARPDLCNVGGSAACTTADAVIVTRALLLPATATVHQTCAPAIP